MRTLITTFLFLLLASCVFAQSDESLTGSADSESSSVAVSPKRAWGDFEVREEEVEEPTILRQVLLWLPNRVLDLIDVFRIDVGVGPAAGGVVRITKWGQAGIRTMSPLSVRAGDFGRDWPVKVEHSNEFGIGPAFVQSHDREVCPGEVGIGLDVFLIGGYGGICFDELYDFFGGLFLFDAKDDDLK